MQDRGHKELGTMARLKHLAYILIMLALGVWWTSGSQVSKELIPHTPCRPVEIGLRMTEYQASPILAFILEGLLSKSLAFFMTLHA